MGAAYFIVLDRKIEGLNTRMDGKMLARAAGRLEALARQLGVRPLSEFISADLEAAADFVENEESDAKTEDLSPLRHFPAQEGLTTVRALVAHLQTQPGLEPNAEVILQELGDCERILSAAARQRVGWHFEVAF